MTTEPIEAGVFSLNEATRTVRGRLLTYGEHTNPRHKYPAVFPKGVVSFAPIVLMRGNRDHDLLDPVATFAEVVDQADGIDVALTIAEGPEGDQLIKDHNEGKYKRLSPEFAKLVKRGSEVISGVLTGAAFVPEGAFASSSLFSLDPIEEAPEVAPAAEENPQPEPPAQQQEETMSTDVVTRPGAAPAAVENPTEQQVFSLMPDREDLFTLIKRAKEQGDPAARAELAKIGEANMFAFSDVKISGANQLGTAAVQGGWIGHVWEGRTHERIIVPTLTPGPLTKLTWTGWKWNSKPVMAAWAGNKADVPSGTVTASPVTGAAQRYAGGHDLAREFYDFNETEAIEAYGQAMVDSYSELSDKYALQKLWDQSVTNGATVKDTYPTDVPAVIGKIVQGALKVITTGKGIPGTAVVSLPLYALYVMTMRDKTLEFLGTSASLERGVLAGINVIPDPYGILAADEVLVYAKPAARALELPGSPVRVNALDLVHGGVDSAFFGYIGIDIQRPEAIVRIADAADA